ncbi:hypothetical protein RAB80_017562 [Fusarium oxysporum f. sp. vasinfectum]|uniref:Uncharacterized protein n=1 Tax=Fusarium oxysporum f. sp. vasinfectum 25433 TaxID=1089449 RepID=X0L365_FUSOX|nr:hypothetical protein FOTG_16241 [Fusarium oxysporum f. sp. vasinfectum 25433]KAK2667141.1 hypothetical protein RAB80_017562 [Fusarium oxysporum f. sp. vasinfectum]KAK2922701.1 hypothetical protein FoTM2_017554 [Fusarium oxysporum f. sp. vasinfectum]
MRLHSSSSAKDGSSTWNPPQRGQRGQMSLRSSRSSSTPFLAAFVTDGLDECTYLDNSSTSVKKFLHDVTNAVVGTNAQVLFVSRAEPKIQHALIEDAPESFAEYKIMPEDV